MTLGAGSRLGPYEIVSPLGAGGMGEVYRARDARLGREVAVKVLPPRLSSDPERLRRFEKEARSSSSLNHPNVVTVFDIGDADGTAYMAMELVEGRTLRDLLLEGAVPVKRLLGIAAQIADGLARAHGAGIVHRDLKPENVMVRKDGFVKILDFGLAKLTQSEAPSGDATHTPTATAGTEAGVVMGTVGYMSPEQALGQPLDFRSDQFALGAILWEMATGRRAFQRRSAPETLAAIIRDEPEPLRQAAPSAPVPLVWCVERCLAKDADDRYGSTRDLAQDLARLRDGIAEGSLSGVGIAAAEAAPRRAAWRVPTLVGAALLVGAAAAFLGMRGPRAGPPTYRPVSFQRGAIGGARFAPDGKTVLYAAAWEGKPPQLYLARLDSNESTALPFPSANLLSASSTGKLAILVLHDNGPSAIAEVPMAGGAPRELVASGPGDDLQFAPPEADYLPGEDRLAVVREGQLEFPIGKVLVPKTATTRVIGLRFSRDGKQIAYIEFQRGKNWSLGVTDQSGNRKVLSPGWEIITSLAWHPKTGEVWFSGRKQSAGIGVVELHAVTPSGKERLVAQNPQLLIVEDVAADGRVLARSDDWPQTMMCLAPGAAREANLTYLDFSEGVALSADGKEVLFIEGGAAAGATGAVYLRKTDGSGAAVRLGDGWDQMQDLSADKRWVVQARTDRLVLLPVGPGEQRTIRDEAFEYRRALWFPDGKRLLLAATETGHGPRLFVRDLAGGPPRPITPERTVGMALSRDGRAAAAADGASGAWSLYPVEGGDPRPLPGLKLGDWEEVLGFDEKDENLYIASGRLAQRIERYNLATGKRTFFREVAPADTTGVGTVATLQLTPDGKSYCYSFMRALSRLYVVDGLR